jgi:hypothetical protein
MSSEPLVAPTVHTDASHSAWREGAGVGLLGAAAGALWSLIVGAAAGHPFRTWYVFGYGILSLAGPSSARPLAVAAIAFLAFVALLFVVVGRLAVAVAHRADRQPGLILFANTILTLATLALFVWARGFQVSSGLGLQAWLQILGSPLIALWTVVFRVYRTHPSLAADLKRADD